MVSGVCHAMQGDAVSEMLRLLRAQPAKAMPCLHLLRGDALAPKLGSEKAFPETYVEVLQMPKECLKALAPEAQPGKFGSADVCGQQERGATGTLHSMLPMTLRRQPSTKWPRLAHQRHIFRAMLLEQHKAKGL